MKNMYDQKVGTFVFFCLFSFFSFNLFAQVGIGNSDPKTMLDVSGALSLREGPALSVGNGININLGTTIFSQYRITDPTANFSISTFLTANGVSAANGQLLTLINTTTYKMTLLHDQGSNSNPQRRIYCPSGFDLALEGQNSSVTLQYNTGLQRWIVVGYSDLDGYGRNVYNSIGTTDINTNSNAFSNMADMSITFTPKHSTVYVNFSASGTMDKGANFDSNAYANFQLLNGATSVAGTTTLATDRSNFNNCQIASFPFTETFETSSQSVDCWTLEFVSGFYLWDIANGAGAGAINSAHTGNANARFWGFTGDVTKLISPYMNITPLTTPQLSFWHAQQVGISGPAGSRQSQLKVYYRISDTDPWVQLASYTTSIAAWTQRTIALPDASSTYQIAFEGIGSNNGRAVVVDDVTVTGAGGGNGGYLETAWNAGFTMYPVSVTPGVSTTINLRWLRDGNFPNVLRNNVSSDANRSHRNLTIFD